MNEWKYSPDWSEEDLTDGDCVGFVYMFYFPDSNEYYIGSKQMYKRVKNVKKLTIDSKENGWRDYSSSSTRVNQMISDGMEYERTILWGFDNMADTLLVEAILITSHCLERNILNMAIMNKCRVPSNQLRRRELLRTVQNINEWI